MNAKKLMALVAICTAAAMPSWAGTVKFPYSSPMFQRESNLLRRLERGREVGL